MDKSTLERWRVADAAKVLVVIADHAKQDRTYSPQKNVHSTRWHVNCNGFDFELLLTGPKFWDTREGTGGGGAIDLVMHLHKESFKHAVRRLRQYDL